MEVSERVTRSSLRTKLRPAAASSTATSTRRNAHAAVSTSSITISRATKTSVQRGRPAINLSSSGHTNSNSNGEQSRITSKPDAATAKRRVAAFSSAKHDGEGPRKERRINVGEKFQAQILSGLPRAQPATSPDRDVCVWTSRNASASDAEREFCVRAHSTFDMSVDRALYHLYRNDYNYEAALQAAAKASSCKPAKFSDNDEYTFYGLFATYGRNFNKIHQLMPHKSMRSLVEHYYRVKMQNAYVSLVDSEAAGYTTNRRASVDEPTPDVSQLQCCDNCGEQAPLFHINNLLQCENCKKYFEEFNINRAVNRLERPLRLKFAAEANAMAADFRRLYLMQPCGLSKCEEIKQKVLYDCRILRAEARRKDINSSRVVQKLAAETNMDEYRRLLAVSAPAARFKITANWAPNEKYVAVQALVRYNGNKEATAAILGSKTEAQVLEFYTRHRDAIDEALKERSRREEQTCDINEKYDKMLRQLDKAVEIVAID